MAYVKRITKQKANKILSVAKHIDAIIDISVYNAFKRFIIKSNKGLVAIKNYGTHITIAKFNGNFNASKMSNKNSVILKGTL